MRGGVHVVGRAQGPHNPGMFIGDCHRGLILPPPFYEATAPLAPAIRLEAHPAERRACPMHQEGPQIDIAPFTDPEQAGLATGGVLPRPKPAPRRKLPAILTMACI